MSFFENEKPFFPPTVNHKSLHGYFQRVAGEVLGGAQMVKDMQPLMGSEDFSFYQEAVPGYFYFLGMQGSSDTNPQSVHSPHFRSNEDAFPYGAALQASLAANYLSEFTAKVERHDHHDEL